MPLSNSELARLQGSELELRNTPLRLNWEFSDLSANDGHGLSVTFACSVRPLSDPIERRMLQEVLLQGRRSVSANEVIFHFAPSLRAAAAKIAPQHGALQWLEEDSARTTMLDALRAAANATAFACGIEILAPYQIEIQSRSFENERLRLRQQANVERETAHRLEHLHRTAELLKEFQTLRQAAPEASPGRLLHSVSLPDRGAMLEASILASGGTGQSQQIWSVAGPYLVQVEVRQTGDSRLSTQPKLIALPPTVGPLRSVNRASIDGKTVLLIGAQSGAMLVDPDAPSEATVFMDQAMESPHGFNRVVFSPHHRRIYATHASAGIVCWDLDSPAAPLFARRTAEIAVPVSSAAPAVATYASYGGSYASIAGPGRSGAPSGPRNIHSLDSRLILTIGASLYLLEEDQVRMLPIEAGSEILALLPADQQLLAVCEDGTILALDGQTFGLINRERRAGRLRAASILPWFNNSRLLLVADDGPIACIGMDDSLVTQFASSYRGLRGVKASAALVVAVSPDRQRLVLWNSWDASHPAGEVFLTSLARHRIADLEVWGLSNHRSAS